MSWSLNTEWNRPSLDICGTLQHLQHNFIQHIKQVGEQHTLGSFRSSERHAPTSKTKCECDCHVNNVDYQQLSSNRNKTEQLKDISIVVWHLLFRSVFKVDGMFSFTRIGRARHNTLWGPILVVMPLILCAANWLKHFHHFFSPCFYLHALCCEPLYWLQREYKALFMKDPLSPPAGTERGSSLYFHFQLKRLLLSGYSVWI